MGKAKIKNKTNGAIRFTLTPPGGEKHSITLFKGQSHEIKSPEKYRIEFESKVDLAEFAGVIKPKKRGRNLSSMIDIPEEIGTRLLNFVVSDPK